MRLKLFLLLMLTVCLPALAQKTGVSGKIIDATTGNPVSGAIVMLNQQGLSVTTGPTGEFIIEGATPGTDDIVVMAYGYEDLSSPVKITPATIVALGVLRLEAENTTGAGNIFYESQQEAIFDQAALEDEEGNAQSVGVLTGAGDNVYYNAASYNFSLMRFRTRGYDSYFNTTYINGIPFNDLARGRFNYSTLGGMNRAFRNRTNTIGLGAATYGFGGIGGSANINTITSSYAPGFNGSIAYTNSNYQLRAMAMYSTGINDRGWGLTVGAIGRYANEGIIPGTFYNSGGYFLSLEKEFNRQHSLTFTAFGAPTQRATNSATYLEAYQLAGTNLYNPNWGYQDGKVRNARIRREFRPVAVLAGTFRLGETTDLEARAAVEAGREMAQGVLVDSLVIPNVDPSVAPAIMACTETDNLKAVGVMETYSLCAAIHAADAAAKAADIRLLEVRLGRGLGGKSFVLLTGEVAAVTAAVEAAEALEETQGLMGKSVVIPAPHPDLLRSMQ